MKKNINLLFFLFLASFLSAQKYVATQQTINDALQYIYPASAFTQIVFDRKTEGDFLANTTKLERIYIYSNYFLNDQKVYKRIKQEILSADAKNLLMSEVMLSEDEFVCFEDAIFGRLWKNDYPEHSENILCKLNQYLFHNLEKIFENADGKPLKLKKSSESEIEIPYRGRYQLEYSDKGVFSTLKGPLDQSGYKVKYFDDCGMPDKTESFYKNKSISQIDFSRTSKRNWKGANKYYANGNIESEYKDAGDEVFLMRYELSPKGDTLSLREYDYTGEVENFRKKSYTRNPEGKITSRNGTGFKSRYSYHSNVDSISFLGYKEAYDSSVFYRIKEELNISTIEALAADSIFGQQFLSNIESTREECQSSYKQALNSVFTKREINFAPYIQVSCDMLSDNFEERKRPRNYEFPKNSLLVSYTHLKGSVKDENALMLHDSYFAYMADMSKGEWNYYSGLVKYLKGKVDNNILLANYHFVLRSVVSIANAANYANNEIYSKDFSKLSSIIDTLGNEFLKVNLPIIEKFKLALNDEELKILTDAKRVYRDRMLKYYDDYAAKNYAASYGIEKNRVDYYKLITQWQLKHPNPWIAAKHVKYKIGPDFEKLLAKYDTFLGENFYSILYKSESEMFKSLDGFARYRATPFNPYYSSNKVTGRKMRRFSWLLTEYND